VVHNGRDNCLLPLRMNVVCPDRSKCLDVVPGSFLQLWLQSLLLPAHHGDAPVFQSFARILAAAFCFIYL
jgi:hypothetical protein